MNLLFSGLFWGSFLIVIGLSIILKATFNISIPVVRIFFALFFVYLGISIITGGFGLKNNAIFSDIKITNPVNNEEYSIIFGQGKIDLSSIPVTDQKQFYKINVVFGSSDIIINNSLPYTVKTSAVFSGVKTPDGNITSFGNNVFHSNNSTQSDGLITIELNSVFSGVQILKKQD